MRVLSFVTTFVTTGALSLALSTTAWAAPEDDDAVVDADSAALKGQGDGGVTVYDFDDDNVDGEVLSPDGANLASRGRTKHANLISIRPHFLPELISLALDV